MKPTAAILLVCIPLAAAGCSAPVSTYPWKDADTAQRLMDERASGIHAIQSAARLILETAAGESVTLDAALVAEPPGRLRVRAWKLGHAVFDLTLTTEGVWLKADDPASHPSGAMLPAHALTASSMSQVWPMLTGRSPAPPDHDAGPPTELIDDGGDSFTLRRTINSAEPTIITCDVDRSTLTARRYVVSTGGHEVATLTLSGYRDFAGVVFPTRLAAVAEQGAATILLDSPEFNLPLPPAAFIPPQGAVRQE